MIVTRYRSRSYQSPPPDDGMDHADAPLRAAQLIGALVIRLTWHARANNHDLTTFPDQDLIKEILLLCKNPQESEQNLIGILFHLTKILDDCNALEKPKLSGREVKRLTDNKCLP